MVIEPIIFRRSVREYSKEPVLDDAIEDVIKAAQFAPTAHDNKAVEFIVIKNIAVKEKLFDIIGQKFIKSTPVIIVPVSDAKIAQLPELDLAVVSAFMMIQASELKLGTVWKNLNPEWREKVKKLLGVPANCVIINCIPLGYPEPNPPEHTDAEFDRQKIHHDRW